MDLQDVSIHAWLDTNSIKNERGDPITFHDHLFLYDIYRDLSPQLCVMKAAQVGMSILEVLKMFWIAKTQNMDIVYTLPTDGDVQDFVSGKVNRLIAQNPVLQEYCADKDSIFQKAVGSSIVYFRSTWAKRRATMVTADWLIHDEKDASKADVIEQYQSRVQHSKFKWKHTFSHPSVPSYGVHLEWLRSDQKHWFIQCGACKKKQYMDWPASVCSERRCFQCKFCNAELSPVERRNGHWVQKYLNKEWSGYWVNLMMCPWVTADEILKKWEDPETSKEFFYNMMLGLPYESKEGSITRNDLLRNISTDVIDQKQVVIGCDSGLIKHYVIGNRNGIFRYGKCENWDQIGEFLKSYKRSVAVIDALPDLTGPRLLREQFPGRVFLVYYNEDKKSNQIVRWGKGEESGVVHVDRNRMIQHIVEEFKDMRIPMQGEREYYEAYITHWMNIYRIVAENRLGQPVIKWEKKNTEDHWCHATVYMRTGISRFGDKGKILASTDEFKVPRGIKREPDDTHQTDLTKRFKFPHPDQNFDNLF